MILPNVYLKFLYFAAVLGLLFGCGGGGGGSDGDNTPDKVRIDFFDVYGNDLTVNDRKQIVATLNDGKFQIDLSIDPTYSYRAKIFISDDSNIDNTIREQKIVDFECSYYPFCEFDAILNCVYDINYQVSCNTKSSIDEPTNVHFDIGDITQFTTDNKADLYIVLDANAPELKPAQRIVPVTFRYD